jgi:flagellar basal-body rod protein FlgB
VIGAVDTGSEFYRRVLDLRGYRQQILTADIANASTPGFKVLDLDFQEALNTVAAEPSHPLRRCPRDWLRRSTVHRT